jgi:hemolysin activation/secretion protein
MGFIFYYASSTRIRDYALRVACLVALLALSHTTALAQDAGRGQPINPQQPEQSLVFGRAAAAKPKPGPQVPHLATEQVKADTKPFLKLTGISIVGARTLSRQSLAQAYTGYIGKTVSQADLAQIADNVSQLYRDAGYHLSRAIVPVQDIKNGRVQIQVIEGRITDIVLKGEEAARFGVARILDPIKYEDPSQLKTFERRLLLVNQLPGVRITDSGLEEIGKATGRFRLTVYVETWRYSASAAVDNLGSHPVGLWEGFVTANLNSYFMAGDTLAMVGSTAPNKPDELSYGRVTYDTPLGDNGARVGATFWYSSIWPGDVQRELEMQTDSVAGDLRASFVALQSQKASLRFTAAVGAGYFTQKDILGRVYEDNVRTATLVTDGMYRDALDGTNLFSLAYKQGLPILGATPNYDLEVSHFGASGVFSVFDFAYSRFQQFSDSWSVRFAAAGQFATTPLMFSQQFYLGGAAFGRGFDAGEISGDDGVASTIELRYDQTLPYHAWTGYQLYSFVDSGAVWNYNDYIGVLHLVSVGVGGRFYFADGWQAGLAVAVPVSYRTNLTDHQSTRILFSLSDAIQACNANRKCFF